MFHALPPSCEAELRDQLKRHSARRRPAAECQSLVNLGKGVAYRIVSPELEGLRADIADRFAGLLSVQDRSGWRPHITIQNKVGPVVARKTLDLLSESFAPRPIVIHGLALQAYDGGPWLAIGSWPFRL